MITTIMLITATQFYQQIYIYIYMAIEKNYSYIDINNLK